MNKTVNQLKMGTVLSYAAIAIQNLLAILYTPVMLRLMGQSEYGLYQLANSTVSYLGLLSFGFGSSYVRFYYQYKVKNEEEGIRKLNGIFMIVFLCISCICVFVGIGMIMCSDSLFQNGLSGAEVREIRALMAVLILTTALTFQNIIFDCYITAHERYIFQRILLIAVNVLSPVITFPLLLFGFGAMALVWANLFLSIGRVGFNIYYCRKKLDMKFQFRGMEISVIKSVGTFSFYIFLNEVVNQINWNVDKLILGAIKGTGVVAIYSIGSQFNQYFINMSSAVSNVFIPRVNKMVAEKQSDYNLTELFIKIGRVQYIILSAALVGYLLYGKFFIMSWAGKEYKEGFWVGAVIMIPSLIPLIQNIGIEIQRAKNKHKFRSIVYFWIAVGNLIISIPLAKRYGALGSAAGTALATMIGNVALMNWYYHKEIHLDIIKFFKNMVKPSLTLLVAAAVGMAVKWHFQVNSWISFFGQAGFFLVIYFVGLYWFGFNKEEKEQVEKIYNKFRKRRKSCSESK